MTSLFRVIASRTQCTSNRTLQILDLFRPRFISYTSQQLYQEDHNSSQQNQNLFQQPKNQKLNLLQSLLNTQIPERYINEQILGVPDDQIEERLEYWLQEIQVPVKTIVTHLSVLKVSVPDIKQRIEELDCEGFEDVRSMLTLKPNLVQKKLLDIKSRITFYNKKLGITRSEIIKTAYENPGILFAQKNQDELLQTLYSLGYTNQDIFSMISKYTSLLSTHHERLNSTIRTLQKFQIDATKIILKHPYVLNTNPANFVPLMELYQSYGLKRDTMEKIFLIKPMMMTWAVYNMQNKLNYLSCEGFLDEEICELIDRDVKILGCSTQKMQQQIESLKSLGLECEQIKSIILKRPLFLRFSQTTIEQNFNWFFEQGFSSKELGNMVFQEPRVVFLHPDIQQNNFLFLKGEGGFADDQQLREFLIQFPHILSIEINTQTNTDKVNYIKQILGVPLLEALKIEKDIMSYNLFETLGPRSSFLFNEQQLSDIRHRDFNLYLSLSDKEFVAKYGQGKFGDVEQFKQFIVQWQSVEWPKIQEKIKEM